MITQPTFNAFSFLIFILDETHRGYKPGGCFLANLFDADTDAIKILHLPALRY